jgi:hypothetical protein
MFWFKLKNYLKLIMSAMWDNDEKFTKLKNEIDPFFTKLENDKKFTKLKTEREIERVAKIIKLQQDLSFRSKVSRR